MRLIDTVTGKFVEFTDLSGIPPYATLSHTWEPTGEQSYQDILKIQDRHWSPPDAGVSVLDLGPHFLLPPPPDGEVSIWDAHSGLPIKVRRACEIARRDGYRYIWIDSACIDKASSSELSEAINSMYNWYRGAQVCYAFLADVPSNKNVRDKGSKFRASRWFTRGWTLQELIAPLMVVFLSQDWEGLGTKDVLADLIENITLIDRGILKHEKALSNESVADRMRWASTRTTTRVEDQAYSLLGIFGITMPTLYGEGRYAFRRLQEEIIRRIPDQSLFAWGSMCLPSIPQEPFSIQRVEVTDSGTLFAPSPHSFASSRSRNLTRATGDLVESIELPVEEYTHTPYGIRTQLYLIPLWALNSNFNIFGGDTVSWYLVVLGSQHIDDPRRLLSRLCYLHREKANIEFLHVPNSIFVLLSGPSGPESGTHSALMFPVALDDLARVRKMGQLQTKTVYLPHPKPSVAERGLGGPESNTLNLTLPKWAQDALRMRGYTISTHTLLGISTEHHRNSSSLTLLRASFKICIHYRHMLIHDRRRGAAVVIHARVWILSPAPDRNRALPSDVAIQYSPPYTSVTWADKVPLAMNLPARSVHLVADSGDEVTLQLGLDLTAPSRYNLRVEVATAQTARVGASLRPDFEDLPRVLDAPHNSETFKLTLPGSVKWALKMKGYSAHLGGSHSHSLTISSGANPGFTIAVKYFHMLSNDSPTGDSQVLVVVARVTLELSISDDGSSETYQDGPYSVFWSDMGCPWKWSLEEKHIVLATPTGTFLTLHLGVDLVWQSEYYLHVDIEPGTSDRFQPPGLWDGGPDEYPDSLDGIHDRVTLTLLGHVKRALQTEGYQVHFEGLLDVDGEGNAACHRLTLSKVDADFVIVIDYSDNVLPSKHSLIRQELTFRASVKVLPSRGIPEGDTQVAPQSDSTTMDWRAGIGCLYWHLPRKDITLVLPTGQRLTLRLGFYLVWYSEYCLKVEINPRTPRSYTVLSLSGLPLVGPHDSFKFGASTMQALVERSHRKPVRPTWRY